jgi:hypothetical protein
VQQFWWWRQCALLKTLRMAALSLWTLGGSELHLAAFLVVSSGLFRNVMLLLQSQCHLRMWRERLPVERRDSKLLGRSVQLALPRCWVVAKSNRVCVIS